MNTDEWKREQLRLSDQARLEGRADRAARTSVHGVIPNHFFSAASSECRDVFIDGHHYSCISLAQAVAEGFSRFLGEVHGVGARKDPRQRVRRLCAAKAISPTVRNAFLTIWGNDRNTFHHLNREIQVDHRELERRAEECVAGLLEIEAEVFAFAIDEGKIVPARPQYWPKADAEHLEVYLRLDGH